MAESTRPSMKSVQRSLIIGVLVGLIFGCVVGIGLATFYIRSNPPVYAGGAHPKELTQNYQSHYLAMVVDSYLVNGQFEDAQERLQTFDQTTKIEALGRWSAIYVAGGRAAEAQAINQLAAQLNQAEGWDPNTISAVAGKLTSEFQGDNAKVQAITTFANQLGYVPLDTGQPPAEGGQPPAEPAPAATPAPSDGGGFSWTTILLCLLLLLLVALVAFVLYRRLGGKRKAAPKAEVVWEGEGPAPLKQWSGTYELGQDNYDEFFTIETEGGDFLGESGMGILEAIPGTKPKQVIAFDVGLFDKTDITTLSRAVMSEHAYSDEALRAKVDANPQAEVVLAKPGETFTLETTAMRVEAKIEEMEYGEGGNVYFDKLKIALDVFVKEGADLRIGSMDVPDEYKM